MPLPTRLLQSTVDGCLVSDPEIITRELLDYWQTVESWPSIDAKNDAVFWIDDHLTVFLPCYSAQVNVTPAILADRIKRMKAHTAPGPDGWTVPELRKLPEGAWASLIHVMNEGTLGQNISMLYRRVPIEKGEKDLPKAEDLRPIDIFSVLWRVFASAQVLSPPVACKSSAPITVCISGWGHTCCF